MAFRCDKCGHDLEYAQPTFGWVGHHYCPNCALKKCQCGKMNGSGWDPNCIIPLHKQIYDRPMGMTD